MRKRIRPLISTSVLVIITGAIFFAGVPELFAQNVYSYQLRVFCGDSKIPTGAFWKDAPSDLNSMGVKVVCAGNCPGGRVSLADALAGLPGAVSGAFYVQIAKQDADAAVGKAKPLTCLRDGKEKPPEEKKPKCEPPSRLPDSPWLDPDVPCAKRERGVVSWKHMLGTRDIAYTVKICGETINYVLKNGAGRGKMRRQPGARSFDVCCESWLSALNSKSPCDVRKDTDCDEVINEIDRFPDFPLDIRRRSDFFVMNAPPWPTKEVDPPLNYLHAPDQSECKDCKWELIKYEFTTKKIPNRGVSDFSGEPLMDTEYRFKTLWKCPINGQTKENYEVVTVKATPTRLPHDIFGERG